MRIYALSDIHTDHRLNWDWIESLDNIKYQEDILILAGDISDQFSTIEKTLKCLANKFHKVCYVPGNHELWVREKTAEHSLDKFNQILTLCNKLGVYTTPLEIEGKVTIIPLFSWYVLPNEGTSSLHLTDTPIGDLYERWSDFYFTRWPLLPNNQKPADFFMSLNDLVVNEKWQKPIITFSHFLPRKEVIFPTLRDYHHFRPGTTYPGGFNFSAVAGDARLQNYIEKLGSSIHVYGHQHRNRNMKIDDVVYISNCLGYPGERMIGKINIFKHKPLLIYEC